MRFTNTKRRQPPAVIIISLIDVLIVMLIFMMVTTTFKQQPALKLTLPESKQPREGVSENRIVVTIAKEPPHFWLGTRAVTLEKLQQELRTVVQKNPQVSLSINADTASQFGQYIKVVNAALLAGIRSTVYVHTKNTSQR